MEGITTGLTNARGIKREGGNFAKQEYNSKMTPKKSQDKRRQV